MNGTLIPMDKGKQFNTRPPVRRTDNKNPWPSAFTKPLPDNLRGKPLSAREHRMATFKPAEETHPSKTSPEAKAALEELTVRHFRCAYCGMQHNPRANTRGSRATGGTSVRSRVDAVVKHIKNNHPDKHNYAVDIRDRIAE